MSLRLPAIVRGGEQLRAVGEEFRRAAFVGLDMRRVRTDHAVIGLAERGQRQRVGGGAVEDEEHLAIGLEQPPEAVGRGLRPGIGAVGGGVAGIGRLHRGEGLRADPGIVVAGELLFGHGTLPLRIGVKKKAGR
jgi:hypothetical protein